jgi:hypothetical protein
MGDQVRIEELMMSDLVIGVVVDILGHVRVKHQQGVGVGFIPGTASAWEFVVLHAAEFVVLDPKIGLE